MLNRYQTPRRKEQTLNFETVYRILRMTHVDKMPAKAIAKILKLKVNQVNNVRAAKSCQDHVITAIAALAKEGLLDG